MNKLHIDKSETITSCVIEITDKKQMGNWYIYIYIYVYSIYQVNVSKTNNTKSFIHDLFKCQSYDKFMDHVTIHGDLDRHKKQSNMYLTKILYGILGYVLISLNYIQVIMQKIL